MTYAVSVLRALGAIGGLAVASRIVYGPAFETYDPMWSLVWGRELTRGELPDLETVEAPTSHPLADLLGALGSLFGQGGTEFLELVSFLSLGLLAWACFRLGRILFGPAVGLVLAALVLTRAPIVFETLETLIDIPFLALVVLAASLEAERPRRGLPVLALLGAAGLLRPEAWLLTAAYVLYLSVGAPPKQVVRWSLAGAAAPIAWCAFDLLATGDPFHSLHGTRELAGELGRPRGVDTALLTLPRYLEFVMGQPLLWAGLAGLLVGLALLYRQSLLPAAILALGLVSFPVLGVAGVSLLHRYVFLSALVLCLFAAVGLAGWLSLPSGRERRVWSVGAALVAALLAVFLVPADLDRLRADSGRAARMLEAQGDLRDLLEGEAARSALLSCRPFLADNFVERPTLAYRLNRAPESFSNGFPERGGGAVLVRGGRAPNPRRRLRLIAKRGEWAVYASGCAG